MIQSENSNTMPVDADQGKNASGTVSDIDPWLTPSDSPDVHGWQPIETAPQDGKAVLLYCPHFYFGPGVWLGWWGGSYFEVCTEGNTQHTYSDDGATHWMPLPDPPVLP